MIKLSILIPSLPERIEVLGRLLKVLEPQLNEDVELLSLMDNRKRTIGKKREIMIKHAQGEYVVFIDDDDCVPIFYVEEILKALDSKPDCVGFEGNIISTVNKVSRRVIYSLRNAKWDLKDDIYLRTPQHLTPVKREIATKFIWPDVNEGEDNYFSGWLWTQLKTEVYIDKIMYFYEANYTI